MDKDNVTFCAYFETAVGCTVGLWRSRVFGFGGILAIKAGNKCVRSRSIKMAQWTWICPSERGTKCRKQLWMQRSGESKPRSQTRKSKGNRWVSVLEGTLRYSETQDLSRDLVNITISEVV